MLNIIKVDLFRFAKSKVWLKIFLGLSIYLLIGNVYSVLNGGHGSITIVSDLKTQNEVSFYANGSEMMLQLLRGSNLLFFCLLPLVLNIFVSDFKWGTLKNELSFRYSRRQFYLAKFILTSLLAVVLPIFYVLYGLGLNQLFHGFSGTFQIHDFLLVIQIVLLQAPIYIGLIGMLLLLGIICQSNTLLVGIALAYQMAIFFLFGILGNGFFANFEPLTCLNSAAFFQYITLNEKLTIVLVGFVMMVVSAVLGNIIFYKKAIQ